MRGNSTTTIEREVPLFMQGEPSLLDVERAWQAAFDAALHGHCEDAIALRSAAGQLMFEYITGPMVDIARRGETV